MIRLTSCPWVIVEPCYLSNDQDFNKIDPETIALGIFAGVVEYWETVNK
jgi:N-acetylmuramoyl-L-alanine amidase